MAGYKFELAEATLIALPQGGLWWQERALLCVSDLHFGKAERIAREGGGLVPPYDTRETLSRLHGIIEVLRPEKVIALGDSFDDAHAEAALARDEYISLAAMMSGRHWIWIAGNHDPGPVEIGGTWRAEYREGPLVFRHIAQSGAVSGEISGHYHPKHRVVASGRAVSRPAFVYDAQRVIMPAFGAYTGGMRTSDPVLAGLFGADAIAVMTGRDTVPVPLAAQPA